MSGYKGLEIYRLAYDLAIKVHQMSLKLPSYELYEQGSQVRRSTKSIKDTIAEGYGRRRYKTEFIRYLIFAHSSCDEALSQLNMISDIHYPDKPLKDVSGSLRSAPPRSKPSTRCQNRQLSGNIPDVCTVDANAAAASRGSII